MKKLGVVALALFLTGCKVVVTGTTNVYKNLEFVDKTGKFQTALAGSYINSKVIFAKNKPTVLQLTNVISIPLNLPQSVGSSQYEGEMNISADQLGQPFGANLVVTSSSYTSQPRYDREYCVYDRYTVRDCRPVTHCEKNRDRDRNHDRDRNGPRGRDHERKPHHGGRDRCHTRTVCEQTTRTIDGRRDVVYTTTDRTRSIQAHFANGEPLGTFQGSQHLGTSTNILRYGVCERY